MQMGDTMRNTKRQTADGTKAIAYLRVSTGRQELGTDAQREAIERWAKQHGVEVVATFEDRGVSGGAPLDKRPGLLASVDALRQHGAGVLVVAKRDRLTRDPIVGAMVEQMAERVGAQVVTADGAGSGDSPADVLMRRMVDAFAEYERLVIKARTKAALAVKRNRGEKTGGATPYGWQLAADGRMLEPHPDESKVVALVHELLAEDLTLRAICETLSANGIRPRRGEWHPEKIRRIANTERQHPAVAA